MIRVLPVALVVMMVITIATSALLVLCPTSPTPLPCFTSDTARTLGCVNLGFGAYSEHCSSYDMFTSSYDMFSEASQR